MFLNSDQTKTNNPFLFRGVKSASVILWTRIHLPPIQHNFLCVKKALGFLIGFVVIISVMIVI